MIAVDTNLLVRLLTGDDEAQHRAGAALFRTAPIFIPDSVVLESEWVLRCAYDLTPADVCAALRGVFGLPNVSLANPRRIAQILAWHEGGLDFADAFHLALCDGHEALKTFDRDFVRRARGLSTCRVDRP